MILTRIDDFITMTGTYCNRKIPDAQKSLFMAEYQDWLKDITNFDIEWLENAFRRYLQNTKTRDIPRPYEIIQLVSSSQIKYKRTKEKSDGAQGVPVPPEVVRAFFREVYEPPVGHSETFEKWVSESKGPLVGDVKKIPSRSKQEAFNSSTKQEKKHLDNVQSLFSCMQHELSEDKRS